ncbi:MAG: S8 family serine peptidase [Chloroflexi bacterium]|nr:S8 family serine peptidase [Chloroflexota bacterium]
MRRTRITITLLAIASLVLTGPVLAASPRSLTDGATKSAPTVDTSSALVQLNGDPLSTYVKTKPGPGKKVDFNSSTVKSYRAQLSALRNDFKQWLRANAPKAKITGSWDLSLNAVGVALNGTSLALLRSAPQVKAVEYQGLYYPLDESDPDLSLISAQAAWEQTGGAAGAGAGVKVAIVDTGIDVTHPCFDDSGYAPQTQLGDRRFTNNKVIVAKVFNNKGVSRGYTAEAVQEHGTHVAGTVACNLDTPATVGGVDIPYDMSGVAPAALLGNYNIFPGDVASARSEDILNALDAAYADGFDVANMSLGGGASGIQDLLTVAVNDLDVANMVVAVAAGNSGPGAFTVDSPGSAARALSAGAATVGHFIATPVEGPSGTYPGASGDFATVTADVTAELEVVTGTGANGLSTACDALPAGSLTGKIALITRGVCSFSTKIRNAQTAGAAVVLVGNSVAGDPISMGSDGTANQPTVPAYMLSRSGAGALKVDDGSSVTVRATQAYFYSGNNDIMAGFSSQGPTDVDFRVKPDVVAPGVNVLSSIPAGFCNASVDTGGCFAFFQGTSMATPHLAGSAAVVRGAHPDWSAWQVRSAIVNTADEGVLKQAANGTTNETNVNIIGAGRENLLAAVGATAAIDPVSVSFGAVPSGSGQSLAYTVTISNLSASSLTFDLSVGAGGGGVAYSLDRPSINLAAGASGTFAVRMTAAKGASAGGHQATLRVSVGGNPVAHAVVYTFIK